MVFGQASTCQLRSAPASFTPIRREFHLDWPAIAVYISPTIPIEIGSCLAAGVRRKVAEHNDSESQAY